MNTCALSGHITQKPKFSMVDDENGEKISFAFFRVRSGALNIGCVATGQLAEKIELNLKKGAQIFAVGHLRTRKYRAGTGWKSLIEMVIDKI